MARLVSAWSCVVTTFLVGFRQAMYLVTSTGSLFAHKTTSKGRKLLDRILENTSFVCCDNIQEIEDTNEEPSTVKSEHTSSTSKISTVESSPKPWKQDKEEIQPSKFPFLFDGNLFLKIMEIPQTILAKRDHQSRVVLLYHSRKFSSKRWCRN